MVELTPGKTGLVHLSELGEEGQVLHEVPPQFKVCCLRVEMLLVIVLCLWWFLSGEEGLMCCRKVLKATSSTYVGWEKRCQAHQAAYWL